MLILPEPDNAPLRGGPTLRWGVLAPGRIAHDWVETVHANTDQRVHAVASRDAGRAEQFARRHGIDRHHGSYEALVGDPGVDIVYIAAPHSEHRRLALLAIAGGKHVLIEKPFALTGAEAEDIAAAARAAEVFAMEAMWTRFLPQNTVVARLIADGAFGALRYASADFGSRVPYNPASRAFDPALGGGALLDLGVYSLWWVTFALGAPQSAVTRGNLAATGVDEQATVLLDYGTATGVASASVAAKTPTTALLAGEEAWLEVDGPFCAPGGFRVFRGDDLVAEFAEPTGMRWRTGLCYQATAVAAHIAAGRTEAPEHPLSTTLLVQGLIDDARGQLGAR